MSEFGHPLLAKAKCDVTLTRPHTGDKWTSTLLDGSVLRLGRAENNDFVLDFDGVSAYHAEFFLRQVGGDRCLCLRDNSKNGTGVRPGPKVGEVNAWKNGVPPPWEPLQRGTFFAVHTGWQLVLPLRNRKGGSQPSISTQTLTVHVGDVVLEDPVEDVDGEAWEPHDSGMKASELPGTGLAKNGAAVFAEDVPAPPPDIGGLAFEEPPLPPEAPPPGPPELPPPAPAEAVQGRVLGFDKEKTLPAASSTPHRAATAVPPSPAAAAPAPFTPCGSAPASQGQMGLVPVPGPFGLVPFGVAQPVAWVTPLAPRTPVPQTPHVPATPVVPVPQTANAATVVGQVPSTPGMPPTPAAEAVPLGLAGREAVEDHLSARDRWLSRGKAFGATAQQQTSTQPAPPKAAPQQKPEATGKQNGKAESENAKTQRKAKDLAKQRQLLDQKIEERKAKDSRKNEVAKSSSESSEEPAAKRSSSASSLKSKKTGQSDAESASSKRRQRWQSSSSRDRRRKKRGRIRKRRKRKSEGSERESSTKSSDDSVARRKRRKKEKARRKAERERKRKEGERKRRKKKKKARKRETSDREESRESKRSPTGESNKSASPAREESREKQRSNTVVSNKSVSPAREGSKEIHRSNSEESRKSASPAKTLSATEEGEEGEPAGEERPNQSVEMANPLPEDPPTVEGTSPTILPEVISDSDPEAPAW